MALSRVNLLPVSVKGIRQLNQVIRGLRLAATSLLLVFIVMIAFLFGSWFLTNQQIRTWSVREKELLGRLTELSTQEIIYRRFVAVVETAEKILGERKQYQGILLDVYSRLPEGTYIEDLQFTEDKVRVKINALDVHRYVETVERFKSAEAASFDQVSLATTNRGINGRYSFDLELRVKKQNG